MCRIVGYVGTKEAYPVIVKGLKRLKYRGYDSWGMALLNGGVKVYKKLGKVAEPENEVIGKNLHSHVGIGHTRWATHGEPSDRNAHALVTGNGGPFLAFEASPIVTYTMEVVYVNDYQMAIV